MCYAYERVLRAIRLLPHAATETCLSGVAERSPNTRSILGVNALSVFWTDVKCLGHWATQALHVVVFWGKEVILLVLC